MSLSDRGASGAKYALNRLVIFDGGISPLDGNTVQVVDDVRVHTRLLQNAFQEFLHLVLLVLRDKVRVSFIANAPRIAAPQPLPTVAKGGTVRGWQAGKHKLEQEQEEKGAGRVVGMVLMAVKDRNKKL